VRLHWDHKMHLEHEKKNGNLDKYYKEIHFGSISTAGITYGITPGFIPSVYIAFLNGVRKEDEHGHVQELKKISSKQILLFPFRYFLCFKLT